MSYVAAAPVPRLTAYRGYAAVAIMLFHSVLAFDLGSEALVRAGLFKVAVSFFFVLSGFVLTHAGTFDSTVSFWWARAARILPLYVFAWLLVLIGRSWLHWVPSQPELLSSLLLVQAWVPDAGLAMSVNPVGWSLSCEAACYLALPLFAPTILRLQARQLKIATVVVAGWLIAGALLTFVAPIEWWVGYRASEFAAGVVLAAWLRRGWIPGRRSSATALMSALLLTAAFTLALAVPIPLASLLAMPAIVYLVASTATANPATSRWGRPGQLLGRWSYALYLTHWIVVVLMSRFGSEPWRIVLAMLLSIALAAVACEGLERPLQRRLTTWARPWPPRARTGDPSVATAENAHLQTL